ncbi:hypothetical protein HNV10_11715 [Winogradskyella litoriviva]|uniref:DUF4198 domain-containing protein n=1 Tax=Winogradskyella litoriviva TaxID=1220182 RepID=A0ABX2E659_9FLAO|nr:hypothetical protein [Winogradskyella litoriviva]NRD23915.1 hypothetical protein [Winogradskyella litoriviva]
MMIKKYSLFVFITVTLFSYSQEINFQKNDNSTATELLVVQKLNKSGDSLILESEKLKIRQVDILNDNYFETIKIDSIKTKIGLNKLPVGNYVIQARIKKHWIVMYFEKTKDLAKGLNIIDNKNNTKLNLVSIETKDLKNDSINSKQNLYKKNTMYWVVYETNSPFSTTKTMSLKYPEEIDDLIAKIKLDVKSKSGENNKLLVYEVYNTSEFMNMQLKNRLYYKNTKSDYFNVIPLYSSEN